MNVLVVVAHPDDEVFLCGGTIAKHVAAGDRVRVTYFTDGVSARPHVPDGARERRRAEFVAACTILGAEADGSPVQTWGYDNRLDKVGCLALAQAIERCLEQWRPEVVYTHYGNDLNVDHNTVSLATEVATRPSSTHGRGVRAVYAGEVPGGLRGAFHPQRYVALTPDHVEAKMRALAAYVSERQGSTHPRSSGPLRGLLMAQGAHILATYAEAFVVLRETA